MKKVFNWSELHLSEVTSYKIHILVEGRNFHHTGFLVDCRTKTRLKCKEDVLGYKYRLAELDIYAVATTSIKEVRTIGASKRVS